MESIEQLGRGSLANQFYRGMMQEGLQKEYWHERMMKCHNRNRKRKKNMLNVSKLTRKKG